MRPSVWISVLVPVLLALTVPVRAQAIDEHLGYFPIDQFSLLTSESMTLEVNLSGAMLGMVAAALDEEDPEFSQLVRGLAGIRIRIGDIESLDLSAVRSGLGRATSWLEDHGWETFIRLREDDEELYVYMRMDDGDMVGTTVLVLEPEDQVVMVNVVGRLDLALLAGLADSLDIPQLDVAGLDPDEDEPDSASEDSQ